MFIVQKTLLVVAIFLLLLTESGLSQKIGIPFVNAYSRDEYGFGTQNWDIVQSRSGIIYVANNEGLLEFDGTTWEIYPLPNRSIARALMLKDNNIYVGGQNEFGFYHRDSKVKWRFKSLKHLIPENHQDFEDIWTIVSLGENIYFRASDKIFIIKNGESQVLDHKEFQFLGKTGNAVFVQDKIGSFYELKGDVLSKVSGSDQLEQSEVRDVISFNDKILIATYKKGLFSYDGISIKKWNNQGESFYSDQYINKLDVLDNNEIVIGTGFNGLIIIDTSGTFKYKISKEDGIPNNRVNCTLLDRHKNLWVGLDNGLAMIQTNSPFSRIIPGGDFEEAGYDVALVNGKLYFGTNNGLFYLDVTQKQGQNNYKLVKNTNGQVYGIDVIDGQLFLSHHEGGFIIKDDIAIQFYEQSGTWTFLENELHPDLILSGTFNGISVFNETSLKHLYNIPNLNVSSRFIERDEQDVYWMSHPYLGVYRITAPFNPEKRQIELLGEEHGLPSNLQNHIFKINDELLICARDGIYNWNEKHIKYTVNQPWNEQFGHDVKVRRLFEGQNNDIWFITEAEIGVIQIEEKGLERNISRKVFPQLKNLMNDGWEKVIAYDEQNVFITSIHGFIHYDGDFESSDTPRFEVVLNEMVVNKDSIIYPFENEEKLAFPHTHNNFLFSVGATDYIDNHALLFQYLLEGYDEDWTPLTTLRTKEYNNLPPGSYTLMVRATNSQRVYSPQYNLAIEIGKPWYASNLALVIYLLLFLSTAYVIYSYLRKKYNVLEEIIDTTVTRSKEEILQLKTEKMQAELDHKNRELVSATLHLVQKNDALSGIAENLNTIRKKSDRSEINDHLQKLITSLKTDDILDQGWDQVMYHFNEVHRGFFERLMKTFPSITPKDQKMCAYLKMNLSSKEMATLMKVSLRGVEASRYRLRKKLNLGAQENLNEFLMKFS